MAPYSKREARAFSESWTVRLSLIRGFLERRISWIPGWFDQSVFLDREIFGLFEVSAYLFMPPGLFFGVFDAVEIVRFRRLSQIR